MVVVTCVQLVSTYVPVPAAHLRAIYSHLLEFPVLFKYLD